MGQIHSVQIPCVPDQTSDGYGRIGVQIYSNISVDHEKAASVADAFDKASGEFKRLGGLVTGGLVNIATNFSQVAGQLSGPVAIVAAGSEIAKADSAGLFQVLPCGGWGMWFRDCA